ncbi:MAG: phosphatidylserine decarboxylase family protein [Bacteroidaceae bacterium]|nr:phosphatidylserine decarboxylase family protein [Bacteroidaceae bacterium]
MKRIRKIKKMRIHREGTGILITSLAIFLAVNAVSWYLIPYEPFNIALTGISLFIYMLMVNFFRSPKRHFEGDVENMVIAPADGRVVVVEKVFEPDHFKEDRIMISIFMSPMNVHANWYPVEGTITRVEHKNGRFHKAWLPKASTENERSLVVIRTDDGTEVLVRQVAGAMARRIVTYAEVGEECVIDEHMGFIKFGSRVDVYLPLDAEVFVDLEQRTVGNETVLAKLK